MKYCTDCKHFMWVKPREGGVPAIYDEGFPTCSNPDAWKGVEVLAIGVPLNIGWARSGSAACGGDGNLWEKKDSDHQEDRA